MLPPTAAYHHSALRSLPHFSVYLDSYPLQSFHILAFYKLYQLSNDEVTTFIAMYNFPFFPTMFLLATWATFLLQTGCS